MKSLSVRSILLLLVLSFASSSFAKSKGPCTCDDVQAMKDRLKMIEATREAWTQVLTDIFRKADGSPQDLNQAKQDFRDHMGWTSTKQVGGLDPNTGDPRTDEDWESQNCEDIVEANKLHERSHAADWRFNVPIVVILSGPRALAKVLAMSEIDARNKEEAYLQQKLDEVLQKCGQWRCKCNGELYDSATSCSKGCPRPSLACIAPTCYEIDPKTGKNTGKAY